MDSFVNSLVLEKDIELYRIDIDCLVLRFDADFKSIYFESFFEGLSVNSNQKFGVSFLGLLCDVVYLEQRGYSIVMFQYEKDMVVELKRVVDIGLSINVSYFVTFYSSYFYLPHISFLLPKFINQYNNNISVSRCDICVDINIPVQILYNSVSTKFTSELKRKNKVLETVYLGKKENNKRHFIRIYDKIKDTIKKGKYTLFSEYITKDCVSRIEAQLNTEACRMYNINVDFLNNYINNGPVKSLFNIIRYLMVNPSGTYFPHLMSIFSSEEEIPKYLKKSEKPTNIEILDRLSYAKIALGYCRRLLEQDFDILGYLSKRLDYRSLFINSLRVYYQYAVFSKINNNQSDKESIVFQSKVYFDVHSGKLEIFVTLIELQKKNNIMGSENSPFI